MGSRNCSKTIVFYVDGQPVQAQVIKRDLKENLALIKIEKSGLSASGFFMEMAKYVRKNHVQTNEHWLKTWDKTKINTLKGV